MKKIIFIVLIALCLISIILVAAQINSREVKVGIIDSSIKLNNLSGINIKEYVERTTSKSNHGLVITKILTKNVNVELSYYGVLDDNAQSDIDTVIQAIYWCVDNDVDIINMSFATLEDNIELKKAIDYAINNNVIVVAACMNFSAYESYPAAYDGVISVSTGDYPDATIVTKNDEYLVTIDNEVINQKSTSCATAYVSNLVIRQLKLGYTNKEKIIENVSRTIQRNERSTYKY